MDMAFDVGTEVSRGLQNQHTKLTIGILQLRILQINRRFVDYCVGYIALEESKLLEDPFFERRLTVNFETAGIVAWRSCFDVSLVECKERVFIEYLGVFADSYHERFSFLLLRNASKEQGIALS